MRPFPEVGHDLEFTATVEESAVREFADLASPNNRGRSDEVVATGTVHEQCLVQGVLLVELVNSALKGLVGEGYVLSEQELRFPSAVSIGEEVTVASEVVRVHEHERTVSVETRILRENGETAFRGVGRLAKLERAGSRSSFSRPGQ